ncbi:MAG: hypothetical protein ACKVP0_07160 [Pirellulaceae bacterium]
MLVQTCRLALFSLLPLEMEVLVHLANAADWREMTAVEKEEVLVGLGR